MMDTSISYAESDIDASREKSLARGKILYVVQGVPGSNAPTKHAFAIADLLKCCGYDVEFLLAGILDPSNEAIHGKYDYPFEFPDYLKLGRTDIVKKYIERVTSILSLRAFDESVDRVRPDYVIYYGIESRLAAGILHRCRLLHVPVLVDETDWFDARFTGDFAAWIVEKSRSKRVEKVDRLVDAVIAISPYFMNYFNNNKMNVNLKTFFLPPLNRCDEVTDRINLVPRVARGCTKFIYAGSPAGGKDQLVQFLEGLSRVKEGCKTRAEAHIVGISTANAEKMFGSLARCEGVYFYGQRSHAEVIEMLRYADFGILFRRPERYARAGFSTKFAECMSHGVPMLCNKIGGADLVIDNGIDGLVIDSCSSSCMDDALRLACNMSDVKLVEMKRAAFEKAQRLFNLDNYIEAFGSFMRDLSQEV